MRSLILGICMAFSPIGLLSQQKNPGDQSARCCTVTKSEASDTRWYFHLEQPEWWVVIIAAMTGISVAWQALETRRATQAMKAGNQANVWAQRARLSIRQQHDSDAGVAGANRIFRLIATNFGHSMAEIFEIDSKLAHYGGDIFKHFDSMDFPAPTANRFQEPHLLSAGEQWKFAETRIDEVVEPIWKTEIEEGRRIPAWYGWVMFKDLAGQVHRRRFFFMFSGRNQRFFEVGPQGWNSED